jgi:hypothetical protein
MTVAVVLAALLVRMAKQAQHALILIRTTPARVCWKQG